MVYIFYLRLDRNQDCSLFIGVNALSVDLLQAVFLSQQAPKGNYVLNGGSPTDVNAKSLHDGQMRILKPFVDRGDIKIVGDTWTKDWDPSEAYAHMSEAIESSKGDITAVVASNNGTAEGAHHTRHKHQTRAKN